MHLSTIIGSAAAVGLVSAHGPLSVEQEIAIRSSMLQHTSRDINHCAAKLKARGVEARAIERRARKRDELIKKRDIKARDLATILATNHNETSSGYTLETSESTIFATEASCVLTAEGESGPYYVAGEYIRQDLVDDQEGVPVHYDFQILDVDTCDPIIGAYFEIFNANSTGVYSGTINAGNGNTEDTTVLDKTFLRGAQATDDEGVASFDTLFAGHYTGRATHIHTILHRNATARENGTIYDLTASHIGQTFWDQSVRDAIELLSPYDTNTQTVTSNADDKVVIAETLVNGTSDPFFDYVQLGDSIEDGFLAWIVLAVNTTLSSTISPAAVYYDGGGVESSS